MGRELYGPSLACGSERIAKLIVDCNGNRAGNVSVYRYALDGTRREDELS